VKPAAEGKAAESSPPYGRPGTADRAEAADLALARDAAGIGSFLDLVLDLYEREGRSFPWRETRDPWAILVSEVMLQQTQTERVVPKYLAWIERFPDAASLARAPLTEVLALWSGLGYNRRALALAKAAGELARLDSFPSDEEGLLALPGVGPYTARAVLAFAFGKPVALIETNVRSAYLHHFFPGESGVADSRILALVAATMDAATARGVDPRTWYYALMDYGADLKRRLGNPNKRSAHYARQSPFKDSHRRIRGAILRELGKGVASRDILAAALPFARERVEAALAELVAEGFAEVDGDLVSICGSISN
jgi:A/G-specific adenine glycosylase